MKSLVLTLLSLIYLLTCCYLQVLYYWSKFLKNNTINNLVKKYFFLLNSNTTNISSRTWTFALRYILTFTSTSVCYVTADCCSPQGSAVHICTHIYVKDAFGHLWKPVLYPSMSPVDTAHNPTQHLHLYAFSLLNFKISQYRSRRD